LMRLLPKSFCGVAALQPRHDWGQVEPMSDKRSTNMSDKRSNNLSDAPKRHQDERKAESRRILASVNDEMQISGLANRPVSRVGNHFAAREADQTDKVEVLGRRIGRALSLVFCIGLIVWLAMFIKQNAS
jgi:hypothetical protein